MTALEKRKAKYTQEYYHTLKREQLLKWKEVPFVCHCCGEVFHLEKVKPKILPSYCSVPCRVKSLDRAKIGRMNSKKTGELNWFKITTMILAGKTGTEIAKEMKIVLATLYKHLKKEKGMLLVNRMKRNGHANRARVIKKTLQAKKETLLRLKG